MPRCPVQFPESRRADRSILVHRYIEPVVALWKSLGILVVAVALLGFALTACGSSSSTIATSERGSSPIRPSSTTPGSLPVTTTSTIIPDISVPVPTTVHGNSNNRATALGRTCWVTREISLAMGRLYRTALLSDKDVSPGSPGAAQVSREIRVLLESSKEQLGGDTNLPKEAGKFRQQLMAELTRAAPIVDTLADDATPAQRLAIFQALSKVLNFEKYPGAKEFAAAAAAEPKSCPDAL